MPLRSSREEAQNKPSLSLFRAVKSLSIQSTIFGIIFFTGYYRISPFWLLGPLLFVITKEYFRAEDELRQQIAINIAKKTDYELVKAIHMDKLPSWLSFPDMDRCEWFNKLQARFWPKLSIYLELILKSKIEHALSEGMVAQKKGRVRNLKLKLGTIPPRIGGVKVYDKNTSFKEVVMDIKLIYAGNCDVTFTFLNLNGGIHNLQIFGLMRLVIKPLTENLPFFHFLEVFFLQQPTIDFSLTGVADFLSLPGVKDLLFKVLKEQISSCMVVPNKLSFPFTDRPIVDFIEEQFPDPVGVLRVNIIEARNLANKDRKGLSDPYVIVSVGQQTEKSLVIINSLDPVWNFLVYFLVDSYTDDIVISVMDKDFVGKDNSLGKIVLQVDSVKNMGTLDLWLQLQEINCGEIHLCIHYLDVSSDVSDVILKENEIPSVAKFLLIVCVYSAENLMNINNLKEPSSVVYLSLGNDLKNTRPAVSNNPTFEEKFMFFFNNLALDKLQVKVVDVNTNTELGNCSIDPKILLDFKNMEIIDQNFSLDNSTIESFLLLSMKLRVLNHSQN